LPGRQRRAETVGPALAKAVRALTRERLKPLPFSNRDKIGRGGDRPVGDRISENTEWIMIRANTPGVAKVHAVVCGQVTGSHILRAGFARVDGFDFVLFEAAEHTSGHKSSPAAACGRHCFRTLRQAVDHLRHEREGRRKNRSLRPGPLGTAAEADDVVEALYEVGLYLDRTGEWYAARARRQRR
jgi:hypothetical protein